MPHAATALLPAIRYAAAARQPVPDPSAGEQQRYREAGLASPEAMIFQPFASSPDTLVARCLALRLERRFNGPEMVVMPCSG